MLILGIVLLVIGACVAAFVHHTIGIIIALVGVVLVVLALVATADAAVAVPLLALMGKRLKL